MSGYIGNAPVPQATQTRDRFVATAGQSVFATSGYTVGYVDVFLNGVKLDLTDFTYQNGSDIGLIVPASEGDIVEIVSYRTFEVAQQPDAGAKQGTFWENESLITADYTITSGKNAGTFGPVTIADGVTVTIPDGSTWTVI